MTKKEAQLIEGFISLGYPLRPNGIMTKVAESVFLNLVKGGELDLYTGWNDASADSDSTGGGFLSRMQDWASGLSETATPDSTTTPAGGIAANKETLDFYNDMLGSDLNTTNIAGTPN